MRTERERRIQGLFDTYAANLALFEAEGIAVTASDKKDTSWNLSDFYICPICFTPFHRDQLFQLSENPLTIEDVPPKESSHDIKRIYVLTCKECNNTAGTQYESHLSQLLDYTGMQDRDTSTPFKVSLHAGDKVLRGDWSHSKKDGIRFSIANKATAPMDRAGFFDALNDKSLDGFKFDARFRLPNDKLTRIAILKSAYLMLFSIFGYSYIFFAKGMAMVRKQLSDSAEEHYPKRLVVRFPTTVSTGEHLSVNIVQSPDWLQSILVLLTLGRRGSNELWGVFFPGPDGEAINLAKAQGEHRTSEDLQLSAVQIATASSDRDRDFLALPEYKHILHEAWYGLVLPNRGEDSPR